MPAHKSVTILTHLKGSTRYFTWIWIKNFSYIKTSWLTLKKRRKMAVKCWRILFTNPVRSERNLYKEEEERQMKKKKQSKPRLEETKHSPYSLKLLNFGRSLFISTCYSTVVLIFLLCFSIFHRYAFCIVWSYDKISKEVC